MYICTKCICEFVKKITKISELVNKIDLHCCIFKLVFKQIVSVSNKISKFQAFCKSLWNKVFGEAFNHHANQIRNFNVFFMIF